MPYRTPRTRNPRRNKRMKRNKRIPYHRRERTKVYIGTSTHHMISRRRQRRRWSRKKSPIPMMIISCWRHGRRLLRVGEEGSVEESRCLGFILSSYMNLPCLLISLWTCACYDGHYVWLCNIWTMSMMFGYDHVLEFDIWSSFRISDVLIYDIMFWCFHIWYCVLMFSYMILCSDILIYDIVSLMFGYMILSNMILCFDIELVYRFWADFNLQACVATGSGAAGVRRHWQWRSRVRRQGQWRGTGGSYAGCSAAGMAASPPAVARHSCVATCSGEALLRRRHQWRGKPGARKNAQNYEKKQQLVSTFYRNSAANN
jgi:hypothetical protein